MTAAAALEFTYEETEVPAAKHTGGTEREPNPHTEAVMRLYAAVVTENAVKALRIAIPVQTGENGEKDTQTLVNKHVRFLRAVGDDYKTEAGEASPFTVKTKVEDGVRVVGTTKNKTEIPVKEIRFWIYTKEENGKFSPARITRTKAAQTA